MTEELAVGETDVVLQPHVREVHPGANDVVDVEAHGAPEEIRLMVRAAAS